jgi:transposase InsO family protein
MRRSIEEHVKKCDACQGRKSTVKFRAPLGDVQEPTSPIEITAMDITGPYAITPRKNRYLLTFIDHFTRYVEAFPIPDMTAETCAHVYVTQIITRHGTGSQFITDQGSAFMSKFFQETFRILGVRRTRTTSLHPEANGCIESFHRTLNTGLSHYINSTHNSWDALVPLYLMAH